MFRFILGTAFLLLISCSSNAPNPNGGSSPGDSSLNAPAPNTTGGSCTHSSACPTGVCNVTCRQSGFLQKCIASGDCLGGRICAAKLCRDATKNQACTSNGDCAPNNSCVDGFCLLNQGQACSASTACLSGRCVKGICAPAFAGGSCIQSNGSDCTTGICLVSGEITSGLCAQASVKGSCGKDTDCITDRCVTTLGKGSCAQYQVNQGPCKTGPDCTTNICNNSKNLCSIATATSGKCLIPGDCTTGNCNTTTNTCVPAAEGGPCSATTDCSADLSCIGATSSALGVCRNNNLTACTNGTCITNNTCVSSVCYANTNTSCTSPSQCMSGNCSTTCQASVGAGKCFTSADCSAQRICTTSQCALSPVGGPCSDPKDCTSNTCSNKTCVAAPNGKNCGANGDCTSQFCLKGVCTAHGNQTSYMVPGDFIQNDGQYDGNNFHYLTASITALLAPMMDLSLTPGVGSCSFVYFSTQNNVPYYNYLGPKSGQQLWPCTASELTMQTDGNLVAYSVNGQKTPIWTSNTFTNTANYMIFSSDTDDTANISIYEASTNNQLSNCTLKSISGNETTTPEDECFYNNE